MCNAHCSPVVDLSIAMALEKDKQDKGKASNAAEEREDSPPAVGVVKPGVVHLEKDIRVYVPTL